MTEGIPYELKQERASHPADPSPAITKIGAKDELATTQDKYDLEQIDINDPKDVKALETMLEQAKAATKSEHKMSLMQALRRYPKASAWSIAISLAVIMEGE